MNREDVYEERIARFLELAEAAQEASERASSALLKVTYAKLASQWVELAQLATDLLTTQIQIRNTHEHKRASGAAPTSAGNPLEYDRSLPHVSPETA